MTLHLVLMYAECFKQPLRQWVQAENPEQAMEIARNLHPWMERVEMGSEEEPAPAPAVPPAIKPLPYKLEPWWWTNADREAHRRGETPVYRGPDW